MIRLGACISLLLAVTSWTYSQSEQPLKSELELLYRCDLAVEVAILKKDTGQYWVEINELIKDDKFGLKVGEKLKVKKDNWPECGNTLPEESQKARMYLEKHDSYWSIVELREEAVNTFSGAESYVNVSNKTVVKDSHQINAFLKEVLTTYALDSALNFIPKISANQLELRAKRNPIIGIIEQCQRNETNYLKRPEANTVSQPAPLLACGLLENQPNYSGAPVEKVIEKLATEAVHPVTEDPLEGKVYVKFNITTTGLVEEFEIAKSLRSDYDKQAQLAIRALGNWQPAQLQEKPVACYMILPVIFKIPAESK